jgi:hypothetical protein
MHRAAWRRGGRLPKIRGSGALGRADEATRRCRVRRPLAGHFTGRVLRDSPSMILELGSLAGGVRWPFVYWDAVQPGRGVPVHDQLTGEADRTRASGREARKTRVLFQTTC